MKIEVPIEIHNESIDHSALKKYGKVENVDGHTLLRFQCNCSYLGDDETFLDRFTYTIAADDRLSDLEYSFDCDEMKIVTSHLP